MREVRSPLECVPMAREFVAHVLLICQMICMCGGVEQLYCLVSIRTVWVVPSGRFPTHASPAEWRRLKCFGAST